MGSRLESEFQWVVRMPRRQIRDAAAKLIIGVSAALFIRITLACTPQLTLK